MVSEAETAAWLAADQVLQDSHITVNVPTAMKAAIAAQARAEGDSISKWVRKTLVAALECSH